MSQPSVTAFFHTRKRGATDDLRIKSKVLVLEHEQTAQSEVTTPGEPENLLTSPVNGKVSPNIVFKANQSKTLDKTNSSVVRNIQFDLNKPSTGSSSPSSKTSKMMTRTRVTRSARKFSTEEGQPDIRDSFLKINNEMAAGKDSVTVPFNKRGLLSPKKNLTPTKAQTESEQPAAGSVTPSKAQTLMEKLARHQDMSLGEIKTRINMSSRLTELRARISKFKEYDQKINALTENRKESSDEIKPPKIKKFDTLELEVPISPQKAARSPMKTPTKNRQLLEAASPQRRLLFEPKETPPSPVKTSPIKAPAYQRFQSLSEKETTALPLPYSYKFLAEVFRCIDTVVAMLFNRSELITFVKLKPAVEKLLRRNVSQEHLAQIHKLYPDAFIFNQEKVKIYGSSLKFEYQLCLKPNIEGTSMGSTVQLERRRVFYNALLGRVKDEHEKFLLSLEKPLIVEKSKITRWHPDFDVDACTKIEEAELPQPPVVQKEHTAQEVLEKAKDYFKCNTRMANALENLAKKNASASSELLSSEETSVIDTPPATPKSTKFPLNPKLKGIPTALLEKIRAKQAAKALEAMTRTPMQDIQVTRYSRLPEIAKILQNIFITEKKKILNLDVVLEKLDNSYRTKLSRNELDEHIKLICDKLPQWISLKTVRKLVYLHLNTDMPILNNISALEKIANEMIKS